MDLRIGTEEAGSELKVPHNLLHCSPLSPFLFACISPQYLYVFVLRSIDFLCQWYFVCCTEGNTWQIQEHTFSFFLYILCIADLLNVEAVLAVI